MKKVTITEYTFDEREANIIRNCLNYCWHRIKKHGKKQAGDLEKVEELRKQLN